MTISLALIAAAALALCACESTTGRPYPPSTVITGITFHQSTLLQAAPGSDQWGTTQASDGNLYLGWGDGGGFGGTNATGRVSMGIARISGTPPSYVPANIWGGVSPVSSQPAIPGKVNDAIISVNGTIYIYVSHQDVWTDNVLWKSTDLGLTWTKVGPLFAETGRLFAGFGILQFGNDYAGARDNYIYGYASSFTNGKVYLFRVLKTNIESRASYEFFSGTATSPAWSSNIANRTPIFFDPNGTSWGISCVYHPGFNRYIMAVRHGFDTQTEGDYGIFDAPEPWGPWTTIAYGTELPDWTYTPDPNGASANRPSFQHIFPQKWLSGNDTWMIFDRGDRFNLVKATFKTPTPSPTPTATATATRPIGQSGWNLITTADFNRNGQPDYVLHNVNTQGTAIWYLNNNVYVNSAYGPILP